MNTPSPYPAIVATYTVKVNHIDVYNDDHINKLQNDVIALQTYIGTNPHGSRADQTTRIGIMMATNGALAQGSAFPTGPVEGQEFWRTDLKTLYVYDSTAVAWVSQGQSLSNTVLCFGGSVFGIGLGAQTYPGAATYSTYLESRFKKISGISTIIAYIQGSCASTDLVARLSIGTVNSSTASFAAGAPNWVAPISLDVSGLANGTVYNVVVDIKRTNSTAALYSILAYGQ